MTNNKIHMTENLVFSDPDLVAGVRNTSDNRELIGEMEKIQFATKYDSD